MRLPIKIFFLFCMLVTAIVVGRDNGQATDFLADHVDHQQVLVNGISGKVATWKLTQRQLIAFLQQAEEKGWKQTRTSSQAELICYQLERKERKVKISYWPRNQMAIVLEENGGKSSQKELLAMLSHPPGELQLTFATRMKEGVCLFACIQAGPGKFASYRSRLKQAGWDRWFNGQVELWERRGERLGISRGESGIMVVWLLKKGGRTFAQL